MSVFDLTSVKPRQILKTLFPITLHIGSVPNIFLNLVLGMWYQNTISSFKINHQES